MAALIQIESSETTNLQGFLSHLVGKHPAKSESEFERWLLASSDAFLSCLGYKTNGSKIRRNASLRGLAIRPDWVVEGADFIAIFEMKHKRAGSAPGCTYQTAGLGQLLMYGAAARAVTDKAVRLYLVDSHIHRETVETVLAYGLPVTLVEASDEKIAVLHGAQ